MLHQEVVKIALKLTANLVVLRIECCVVNVLVTSVTGKKCVTENVTFHRQFKSQVLYARIGESALSRETFCLVFLTFYFRV
jgi:hypothetical protein